MPVRPCLLASHPPPTARPNPALAPAVVVRAIAVFGCQFFLSYGMTECCGKISMSILPQEAAPGQPGLTGACVLRACQGAASMHDTGELREGSG
jgi:acyl-CoA synthetase (AMP-forming)/AMP-acid ligase II